MPMNFQFLNPATGEPVSLNQVDREMCEDTNYPYSDKRYCPTFTEIQLVGCIPRIQTDGKVDPVKLEEYLEKNNWHGETASLIKKYLCEKYQFSCWYSH